MNHYLLNKEQAEKLTPDAIERLILVEMLREAMKGYVLPQGEPLRTIPSDDSKERKKLCKEILATLAAFRYPTPEETYGTNLDWAVRDLLSAYKGSIKKQTGWVLPKIGDKVRFKKPTTIENPVVIPPPEMRDGDICIVEGLSDCDRHDVEPYDAEQSTKLANAYWNKRATYGIIIKLKNTDAFLILPIAFFEPVNE